MVFRSSNLALPFCRLVLMLGAALPLHHSHVLHCIQKGILDEEERSSPCNRPETVYTGCSTMTIKDSYGHTVQTSKSCQELSKVELECLRREGREAGFTFQGNCLGGPYTETTGALWDKCKERTSGAEYHRGKLMAERQGNYGDDTFSMCTCNDGDNCNADCRCDSSYGLCGAQPCKAILPTNNMCFCEGVSPSRDLFQEITECDGSGQRVGFERKNATQGCYALAQENSPTFRGCVDNMDLVECMHGKMKAAEGPGNCVSGTYGEWTHAMASCAISKGLVRTSERQTAKDDDRITACYCAGNVCNGKHVSLEAKSVGNMEHGIWTLVMGGWMCAMIRRGL